MWYFHHEAEVEKQAEREQAQRKASEQLQKDKLTASIDDMLHKEDSSARHLKLYLDNNRDACKMFTDLDRWGELLTRRAEILAYANVKLDEGRGLLDQAVIDRVKASWDRYRADEKDFALARKLDEVQMDSYMLALEIAGNRRLATSTIKSSPMSSTSRCGRPIPRRRPGSSTNRTCVMFSWPCSITGPR